MEARDHVLCVFLIDSSCFSMNQMAAVYDVCATNKERNDSSVLNKNIIRSVGIQITVYFDSEFMHSFVMSCNAECG